MFWVQSGEPTLSLHGRMQARLPLVLRCLLAESAAAALLTSCRLAEAQVHILLVRPPPAAHVIHCMHDEILAYLHDNEGVIHISCGSVCHLCCWRAFKFHHQIELHRLIIAAGALGAACVPNAAGAAAQHGICTGRWAPVQVASALATGPVNSRNRGKVSRCYITGIS